MSSEKYLNNFSHIYAEKDIFNNTNSQKIISNFPNSQIVLIDNYKNIFNRSNQDITLQTNSKKLILSKAKDTVVFKGSNLCNSFNYDEFYYVSGVMGCVYNCGYCYLSGMYRNSNINIFVDIDEYISKLSHLSQNKNIFIAASYDTDLLAMYPKIPIANHWYEFAYNHPNTIVELRTKSTAHQFLEEFSALDNLVLAWTLSPDYIIKSLENKTLSLGLRIKGINKAINKGWKVRICIDPMIYYDNYANDYIELFELLRTSIRLKSIHDFSFGTFRMPSVYLKNMKRAELPYFPLYYDFERSNGVCHYSKKIQEKMKTFVLNTFNDIPQEKLFFNFE